MNFLKGINNYRRVLMRGITRNLADSTIPPRRPNVKIDIKKVLICRPNHRLGNLLLITPLLQEVSALIPHCKIDLFVKGNLAPILFRNYEDIDSIIQLPRKPFQHLIEYVLSWILIKRQQYDIVINVEKSSSSGKLAVQFANSKYKFFGDVAQGAPSRDHVHNAKYPVYALRNYLSKLGISKKDRPIPSLDLKLTPLEISDGKKILRELVKNDNKTICLFTYATGDKCYPASWWENFLQRLKNQYPRFNIIEVLPIQNLSNLSFKAPTFYSKDVRQIGSLIANTDVFIGADSGIMHLASAVKTPTVGLFSVTDEQTYGPYDNNSVAINTNISNTEICIGVLNRILLDDLIYETDSKHHFQHTD